MLRLLLALAVAASGATAASDSCSLTMVAPPRNLCNMTATPAGPDARPYSFVTVYGDYVHQLCVDPGRATVVVARAPISELRDGPVDIITLLDVVVPSILAPAQFVPRKGGASLFISNVSASHGSQVIIDLKSFKATTIAPYGGPSGSGVLDSFPSTDQDEYVFRWFTEEKGFAAVVSSEDGHVIRNLDLACVMKRDDIDMFRCALVSHDTMSCIFQSSGGPGGYNSTVYTGIVSNLSGNCTIESVAPVPYGFGSLPDFSSSINAESEVSRPAGCVILTETPAAQIDGGSRQATFSVQAWNLSTSPPSVCGTPASFNLSSSGLNQVVSTAPGEGVFACLSECDQRGTIYRRHEGGRVCSTRLARIYGGFIVGNLGPIFSSDGNTFAGVCRPAKQNAGALDVCAFRYV